MFFKFSLLLLVVCPLAASEAQKPVPKDTKVITISNKGVKDCFVQDGHIWLLDNAGVVWRLNDRNFSAKRVFTGSHKILAIAEDSGQNIIAADSTGSIFRIEGTHTVQLYNTKDKVLHLLRLKNKALYTITDRYIYFGEEDRLFYQNAFTRYSVYFRNYTHWNPSCVFVDNDLNIWLGFDEGEWGGDIIIFSTLDSRFYSLEEKQIKGCYVMPVRSLFQADSLVYASTSLQHMNSLEGAIEQLTDSCITVFESHNGDSAHQTYKGEPLYIGPTLYREKDSSFYFYCQYGVFKSRNKKITEHISGWDLVCEVDLQWQFGQPHAVGHSMNVTKMFFEGDRLFLISPANGVLIWDGKEKTLLR
jgi:hypothetical protein